MKKSLLLLTLCLITIVTLSAEVTYSAPEFMQAYYSAYSQNYINTLASGRGNTGVAKIENVENILLNPAGFSTDHTEMYIEFSIKPEKTELGHLHENQYRSSKPFTFVGFGFNPVQNLSTALYYAMPKSIEYDRYTLDDFGTAVFADRKPQYNHYSFGFTNAYKVGNLSVGVDVNYNIHNNYNFFINGYPAKENLNEYTFGFSGGAVYQASDRLNFGAMYSHSSDVTFETEYIDWDVTVPAKFSAGFSYYYLADSVISFDYEKRFNSQMSSAYDDIDIFKFGLEQQIRNNIIRFGGMYIPSTFSGRVTTPVVELAPNIIPQTPTNFNNGKEDILSNDQTFITVGYTLNLEELTFNLSAMQAVACEMKSTQFSLSIGVNLSDFDITKYTPKRRDD